ncbi:MAG: phosphoribosyltransferase [Planctomycetota bacterium]|jgi:putative phosphoribosyl transferase
MFANRQFAGQALAERLRHLAGEDVLVIALPRGGVPVGREIARALEAPLDVVGVRKIGAPFQPEFALGALVDGEHPEVVLDDELVESVGASAAELDAIIARERLELARRERRYRGGRPWPRLAGRTVIVVDDGIATGASAHAALQALRRQGPARLVLAVPVAPPESLDRLRSVVDEIVCLSTPPDFFAVGQFYLEFGPVSDEQVVQMLASCPVG